MLIVVAVAMPSIGVISKGEVSTTNLVPVPVCDAIEVALPIEVITPVRLAFVVTLPAVNPAAVPVTFVITPDVGVPRSGVTSVGEVAKTSAPVPVSSVTAAMRFALVGVPRKVATPAARPETPVEIGKPVALVRTAAEGVPNAGVVKVAFVADISPAAVTLNGFDVPT